MMEVKKLVPVLRFKEFEGEWKVIKLGDLAGKIGDGIHGTPLYSDDSDIHFINGNNLTNGKIEITEKTKKVDFSIFKKNDKGLNENSILISLNGTIGNISKYNNEKVMLGKSVGYFNFKEKTDFYFHVFHTDKIQNFFISELTGSTIKNLSLKTLRETIFPLPSLPEQQKIASFLSAVDEKIQQLTKKKELLEHFKKGVMQQLFSGKLRFKDATSTGLSAGNGKDYPEWVEKRLGGYLIHKSSRNKDFKVDLVLSVSNKKGFISQNEQFDGHEVASKDLSNYKIVNRDDIAYNPSRINVGSIARLINFEKGIVSPMYVVFSLKDGLDKIFFENLYNIHRFKHLIKVGCSGSVRDSLNFDDLCDFIFKFPSLEEQQKIATYLSRIDSKIESVNQQITQTQTFKKGLLQQLFV